MIILAENDTLQFPKNDILNYFILLLYPRPLSSTQAGLEAAEAAAAPVDLALVDRDGARLLTEGPTAADRRADARRGGAGWQQKLARDRRFPAARVNLYVGDE